MTIKKITAQELVGFGLLVRLLNNGTKETVKVLWGERKMSRKFANKGGKRSD